MVKTLFVLFISFFQIGLFSIGGGYATIPLIQEQVVNTHEWLTLQEFTDIITISQMTPGPLAVNTSTFVGMRIAKIPGAMVATLGCVVSGSILSIMLYRFFRKHQKINSIANILRGLHASSVGLIASSASTIVLIAFFGSTSPGTSASVLNITSIIVFMVSLFFLRKFKMNPMLIMIVTGVLVLFFYR